MEQVLANPREGQDPRPGAVLFSGILWQQDSASLLRGLHMQNTGFPTTANPSHFDHSEDVSQLLGSLELLSLPEDKRKDAAARAEAINKADAVILCLPDDAAREAVALVDNPATRIIDASTAHRVADG